MPHRTKRQRAGFTLIELMVALGIFGLILLMINELFQSTSVVVTRSVQLSKVTAAQRVISDTVEEDTNTDTMIGPVDDANLALGGYIVIIQQKLQNVLFTDPDTLADISMPELRTDQLVFIRDAAGLRSTTPITNDTYSTSLVGQTGDVARVWYGHALRTNTDGTEIGTALGSATTGLDAHANNWVFGRQALLFNPVDVLTGDNVSDVSGPDVTRSAEAYYDSALQGRLPGFTGTRQLYRGVTDVTRQEYYSTGANPELQAQLADLNDTRADNVENQQYLETAFPLTAQRLNVNPSPVGTDFQSWTLGQSHGILTQSCSEIIVDFAADMNGNGRIDTIRAGGTGDNGGPIFWYDAIEDTRIGDSVDWQQQQKDRDGNPMTPDTDYPQPYYADVSNNNYKVFIFRIDDGTPFDTAGVAINQPHSYWPYLIRIRYRLHDTRGRLKGNYLPGLYDNKDNDGDGRTDEVGEDKISGRWVENIIRVNRPDNQ